MTVVSLREVSKDFGIKKLFTSLTFVVNEGERVALIGRNGSGKSTLLRLVAGLDDPDSGDVVCRRDVAMAYVTQSDALDPLQSVLEAILEKASPAHVGEHKVLQALTEAGFEDPSVAVGTLSGGWRKRLSILQALITEPSLLLLDEPTNHLDTPGILWLEETIANFRGAVLCVSHDRYFVERIAHRTIELDAHYPGGFIAADGGYSALIEKRALVLESLESRRQSLANKVRREVEWLRQGVKARTTKAKYRIDEAHRLISELNGIELSERSSELGFAATGRRSKDLIKAENIQGGYGERTLFSNLSFVLQPGQRLGIVGANGSGKTTLLRCIAGDLAVTKGRILRASHLRINLFGQLREQLRPEMTVKEVLAPDGDSVVYEGRSIHVMSWLQRFLFKSDQASARVSELSGGEQARLLLAKISLLESDVLIFDEPTNDLDIPTLELLERSFIEFRGAIVLVSHDRYLLDRTCTTMIGFLPGGDVITCADYTQFEIQWRERRATQPSSTSAPRSPGKGGQTFKDQKRLGAVERRIASLEKKQRDLQEQMLNPAVSSNAQELMALQHEMSALDDEMLSLITEWEELQANVS